MSEHTDKMKRNAEEKLEHVRNRLDKAKETLQSTFDQTKDQVESRIQEAKASLNETRQQVRQNKAKLKSEVSDYRGEIAGKIDHLKEVAAHKREEKNRNRIITRAEKAEKHAEICIDCATVAIAEAELACLEACHARMEAEELLAPTA